MSQNKDPYWLAVAQDKKGPSTRSRTRRLEVSDGATLSVSGEDTPAAPSPETTQGQPPDLDLEGPGPQPSSYLCNQEHKRGIPTQVDSCREERAVTLLPLLKV